MISLALCVLRFEELNKAEDLICICGVKLLIRTMKFYVVFEEAANFPEHVQVVVADAEMSFQDVLQVC